MKKKMIICFLLTFILCTSTAFADQGHILEDEPNDTFETADTILGEYPTTGYADYTVFVYGSSNSYDTEDWYKYKVSETTEGRFALDMDSNTNLDLYLYDEDGNYISSSTNVTGEDEDIRSIFVRADQYYYLRVVYKSGQPTEPYRLRIYNFKI